MFGEICCQLLFSNISKSFLLYITNFQISVIYFMPVAVGKDKPGPVGRASLSGSGAEKSFLAAAAVFFRPCACAAGL
ncbi:MAG: hypothetical protein LUC96_00065 [Alistipes sp.]|uniref:hypothetical protein n=1 Tax=Alistipes sp. TaxID=1872444 RepID=UPI0025BCC495|nr:hypothetical protein [Alistipes sp.]MCD8273373.1 hypothetical protein [Alistipes sp.]